MQRQFPIEVFVDGPRALIVGADEELYDSAHWHLLGKFATPAELGEALLEWAQGFPIAPRYSATR